MLSWECKEAGGLTDTKLWLLSRRKKRIFFAFSGTPAGLRARYSLWRDCPIHVRLFCDTMFLGSTESELIINNLFTVLPPPLSHGYFVNLFKAVRKEHNGFYPLAP